MPTGTPTSSDLRWAIIRMRLRGYRVNDIEDTLAVSPSLIYNIIRIFEATGQVLPPVSDAPRGRPRTLSYAEIWVS